MTNPAEKIRQVTQDLVEKISVHHALHMSSGKENHYTVELVKMLVQQTATGQLDAIIKTLKADQERISENILVEHIGSISYHGLLERSIYIDIIIRRLKKARKELSS